MKLLTTTVLAASIALAQHTPQTEQGQRLFEKSCTACHGQNAKGGRGPDLTGKLKHGDLDSEIAENIVRGIPGTQMPAFAMPWN